MSLRLRFSLLLLLFGFTLPTGLHAQAPCECDSSATWTTAFDKANVVFLGTCIGVRTNPIKGGMNVIFKVDSSWKRRIEYNATVHTAASNQCGFLFEEGQRYVVFGNKRHQTVETSICEPNLNFADNGDLTLRRLGEGFGPGRPEMGRKMNLLLIGLGLGGLVFVALVVLRKRLFGKRS